MACARGRFYSTVCIPRIGVAAPEFTGNAVLPNKEIKQISLKDYKGKWVVLFFYPLDFTFVCPTEIVAFSEAAKQFEALNTQVIGASVDSVFSHLAWVNTDRKKGGLGDMEIPLLEDVNKVISTAYGALHLDSGHTHRALYLIDPKGVLRHITMNDPPVGRSTSEILRLVEAFQFVEENGEVCPANWSKGKPTMKADPVKSLDYFSKNA